MPEFVDLVNKTNARLLCDTILNSKSSEKDEKEYALLSVFEMLWNVEKTSD
jgi:hypothetical protein